MPKMNTGIEQFFNGWIIHEIDFNIRGAPCQRSGFLVLFLKL